MIMIFDGLILRVEEAYRIAVYVVVWNPDISYNRLPSEYKSWMRG
jgi:hypothetical protein